MSPNYEAIRKACFYKGESYINTAKGIREQICMKDKRPCMFQCLEDNKEEPNPEKENGVTLLSFEYKVE